MTLRRSAALLGVVALLAGGPAAAARRTKKKPPVTKAQKADLLAAGDTAVLLGDLGGAETAYRAALEAAPGLTIAAVRLAWVIGQRGDVAGAILALTPVTDKKGAPPEAWEILAELEAKRSGWAAATAAWEHYLALVPGDLDAQLALARTLRAQADAGDAAARPKAQTRFEAILADARVDDGVRAQAEEELFALKYGPAGATFREAKSALAAGDAKGAVSRLEKVVAAVPALEEAQWLLGVAYASPDVGRRGDALKAWRKAPKVERAQVALGAALHEDGDLAGAEAALRAAIALDGKSQEAWFRLGSVLAEKGGAADAQAAWRTTRELAPGSELGQWANTKLGTMTGQMLGAFKEGQILDPATEATLGQKASEAFIAQFGVYEDPRLEERIQKIWEHLVAASDRPELPTSVTLLDWGVVNAFTIHGGRVFVCRGLIDVVRTRMGDKDEVYAAILAHELAHAVLRHVPENMKVLQAVLNDPNASAGLGRGLATVAVGMTRASEHEADQYGALYLYRAGFDVRTMIELHRDFARYLGEVPPGMDHPPFAEREARVRDFLIELRGRVREFSRAVEALRVGANADAARRLEVFLAVLPRTAAGHLNLGLARHRQALERLGADAKWKRATDLDPDARVKAIELRSGAPAPAVDPRIDRQRLREAAAAYRTALRLDPGYVMARVDYAALLLDLGQNKEARALLETAVKHGPRNALAWTNLAIARWLDKDLKGTKEAFDRATSIDPKLADPWFNQAVMMTDAGDRKAAAKAWDEYLTRDSTSGWAKAARARKASGK